MRTTRLGQVGQKVLNTIKALGQLMGSAALLRNTGPRPLCGAIVYVLAATPVLDAKLLLSSGNLLQRSMSCCTW